MAVALAAITFSFLQAEGCGGRFQKATNIVYSPDGQSLAVCSYDWGDANVSLKSYIADCDRFISVYHLADERSAVVHHDFRGGNLGPGRSHYAYMPLQFSADGQNLLFPSWDGRRMLQWNVGAGKVENVMELNDGFYAFAVTADGKKAFTANYDHLIVLNLESGGMSRHLLHPISFLNRFTMSMSPDERWLAIGGERAEVWDIAALPPRSALTLLGNKSVRFHGVAFAPDSTRLAIAGENGLTVVDLHTGRQTQIVKDTELLYVAFVPYSDALVVTSIDDVKLVNLSDNRVRTLGIEPRWPGAMAVSPDGEQLAVCTRQGIGTWSLRDRQRMTTLPLPRSRMVRWYMPWIGLGAWLLMARRMWKSDNRERGSTFANTA